MIIWVMVFGVKSTEALTIETFSNLAAWETSVSGQDIDQEDLNTFSYTQIATSASSNFTQVSGFKLQELSNSIYSRNCIDTKNDNSVDIDGSSYIRGYVRKDEISLSLKFDNPIIGYLKGSIPHST